MAAIISAIIPTFNAASYIGATLASLQKQTIGNWEAVVIDDGSTDATAEIIRRIAESDARIVLLKQENKGEAAARAAGVKRATADLIYFLDADDIALPDALERLVQALHDAPSNVVGVYGDHLRINAQGNLIFPEGRPLDTSPKISGSILSTLLQRNLFAMGAVAIRRHFITEEDIVINTNYSEDWFMWVHLALKGDFLYLGGAPLAQYRLHRGSQTHEKAGLAEHGKAIDAVFAIPELKQRFTARTLAQYRAQREAFCAFALGCKELRLNDYKTAAALFKRSIISAYWRRPTAWAMYGLATIGWLPGKLQRHLG